MYEFLIVILIVTFTFWRYPIAQQLHPKQLLTWTTRYFGCDIPFVNYPIQQIDPRISNATLQQPCQMCSTSFPPQLLGHWFFRIRPDGKILNWYGRRHILDCNMNELEIVLRDLLKFVTCRSSNSTWYRFRNFSVVAVLLFNPSIHSSASSIRAWRFISH